MTEKIFSIILEEACRQWCDFLVDAPERATGEGFSDFFFEILKEKKSEYANDIKTLNTAELEITKMLTISTAHITEETFERLSLDSICCKTGLSIYVKKSADNGSNYGLFIYIDRNADVTRVPDELVPIINIAFENDCNVICLDSDGPILEGIPVFDWE